MNYVKILLVLMVIGIYMTIANADADAYSEDSDNIYFIKSIQMVFEPEYSPKPINEVKKEMYNSQYLIENTVYANGDIEIKYLNDPNKKVHNIKNMEDELEYKDFIYDLYKQLADTNMIILRLQRFNINIDSIEKVIYYENNGRDGRDMCFDTDAVMVYNAFVLTEDNIYVVYLPIMYDKYYDEYSEKWSNIFYKSYVETYSEWIDSRTLKQNYRVFVGEKQLDCTTFSNRYCAAIPLRKVFESMGASVQWNDLENTVTLKTDDKTIVTSKLDDTYSKVYFHYLNAPDNIIFSIFSDVYINVNGTIYLLRPQNVIGDMLWWFDDYLFIDQDNRFIQIKSNCKWNGITNPMIDEGWKSPIYLQ